VEKPVEDVGKGKSYLSLIMLNPVFQILKIDQRRTCYCMSFGKVKLLSSVSYTPCWLSHPLTLLNLNPCSTQDSSSLALLMVNVLALCLGFSAMLLNKLFQKGVSCYLNFCNIFENCVVCVSFNGVSRFIGFFSKQNILRTGVSMAVCLLCTRAKESLPWPIKDRFVECGSPSITVQPHIWYGTDLDSPPLS